MLLIHGVYHWNRRQIAYRNDYCVRCAAPRLAYLHRTFDVVHVFWIPVLPIGIWKRWHCGRCGNHPHARTGTFLRWGAVVLLGFFALIVWAPAVDADIENPALRLGLRVGLLSATGLAVLFATRAKPSRLAENLRAIQPNRDGTCPRCGTTLTVASPWYRCGKCGLERQALAAP